MKTDTGGKMGRREKRREKKDGGRGLREKTDKELADIETVFYDVYWS